MKNRQWSLPGLIALMLLGACTPVSDVNPATPITETERIPITRQPTSETTTEKQPTNEKSWPMFRRNLENTGSRGIQGLTQNPSLKWRFDTGGTVESSSAIVDAVLYQGSFNEALFALNAESGEELWRFPVGDLLRASPSVVDALSTLALTTTAFTQWTQ
jgi:glucose dehydrogenase